MRDDLDAEGDVEVQDGDSLDTEDHVGQADEEGDVVDGPAVSPTQATDLAAVARSAQDVMRS